ncbi:ABC transporter permease [Microbacterium sp. X-17]
MNEIVRAAPRRRPRRLLANQPVLRAVLNRLLVAIPLLFVVTLLSFLLVSLTPGDAARAILGDQASADAYDSLRHELRLDQPLFTQYTDWLGKAITGDLGTSIFTGEDVTHMVTERLPVTLSLLVGALLVTAILGTLLGIISAVRGGVLGRILDSFSLVGQAVPAFWAGAILIAVFAVALRWLPPTGYVPLEKSPGEWLRALILPVVALSIGGLASVARQTRDAMLEAFSSEYVRAARASGVSTRSIIFRHALKNAGTRAVTVFGLMAVGLVGGTVLVEAVFALPGLGSLTVNAVVQHDIPVIQGIVIYFTIMVVLINLLVDVSYVWINPKARTS